MMSDHGLSVFRMPAEKRQLVEGHFTRDRYWIDIQENAAELTPSMLLRLEHGGSVYFKFVEAMDETACVIPSSVEDGMCTIRIGKGLAWPLYDACKLAARDFRALFPRQTEEFLHRLLASTAMEFAFWHEFAHVVRGHMALITARRMNPVVDEVMSTKALEIGTAAKISGDLLAADELSLVRLMETDADIYGAQFALSRIASILVTKANTIHEEEWLKAFCLGVRVLFDTLHSWDPSENEMSENNTHPHSHLRALIATTHGLSRVSEMGLKATFVRSTILAFVVLAAFDSRPSAAKIDLELIETLKTSVLAAWHENSDGFLEWQRRPAIGRIRRTRAAVRRRIRGWFRHGSSQ